MRKAIQGSMFLAVLLGAFAEADPIQWPTADGGNGHYYEAISYPAGITWGDAQAHAAGCTYMGLSGHLVTITSAAENDFVTGSLGVSTNHYWLGGYQRPGSPEPDGGWAWVTGEPWEYTNWSRGEPSDRYGGDGVIRHPELNGTDEEVLEFTAHAQWNDMEETAGWSGLVVEYESPIVTVTSPTVSTQNATSVGSISATLRGMINTDGGEACEYRFRYKKAEGSYTTTAWTGSVTTGQSFSKTITGLDQGTTYYFIAEAKNSVGISQGLELSFTTSLELPGAVATGLVDVSIVHQELEGFGAAGAWYENWLTAHPKRNEIYDCLFGQLGLDIYRIRNTYDIPDSNITESAKIIQAAEDSLGHPIKVMISSWSPPAYLKSNGSTVRGTLKKDANGNFMYGEFAQWWADALDEYSSHGIDADYVNIQNEPDWLTDWDTCKFTPRETEEWAGYNLAFEAVYQELTSRMEDLPKLLAAEAYGCSASRAYIDALINPDHAYGYAHHLYADGNYDSPDTFIPAMENFAARYDDKPLFQTEYSRGGGEEPFDVALNLARHIHNSFVHEGVCSFFYWDLFWGDEGGLVSLDNPWQASPGYTINPTYYAFKQYSAFTNPGWYRVEASTDSSGLRISGFINPDSTELSIIIINVSQIDIDLSLSLGDFSPTSSRSSRIYRTSETQNSDYIGTFDPSQPLTFPPQSITTISMTGTVD